MQEKNRIFSSQPQKNVTHAKGMAQNQVQVQIDALIVEEMEEYVQTKVFSLFSKHAHNVQEVVKKLQILVLIAMDKVINKPQKKYL